MAQKSYASGVRIVRLLSTILLVVFCASFSWAKEADKKIIYTDSAQKAYILIEESSDKLDFSLKLTVVDRSGSKEWNYEFLMIDHESEDPTSKIVSQNGKQYFITTAYTGGASCCWVIIGLNLTDKESISEILPSISSYRIVEGDTDCPIRVRLTPPEVSGKIPKTNYPFIYQCISNGAVVPDVSMDTQKKYENEARRVVGEVKKGTLKRSVAIDIVKTYIEYSPKQNNLGTFVEALHGR